MTKHLALIVDDEADICELLELTLNRMDINTLSAGDLKTAKQLLREHKISICLTDMRLPDGNGIELVKTIQQNYSHIPVAMISAHGNMDTAIEALKAGAFDFVSKPLELAELRNLVKAAIKLADKNKTASSETECLSGIQHMIQGQNKNSCKQPLLGNSPAMQETRKLIEKLARSQAPVYISGESGTGKELAARQIHNLSSRSDKPFIPVNCGAIPAELMESEFFGHRKGSFTGAIKDKQGLFHAAHGGTLFLDEVADLPLGMQVKLLRAIQEKAVRPVGSQQEEKIDVRLISATHKNLAKLVDEGQFRQDLYYRINVIELTMPSLRTRGEDILLLAGHFLAQYPLNESMEKITFSADALNALDKYSFPGNVRELENILERAVALCDGSCLCENDLGLPPVVAEKAAEKPQTRYQSPLKDEQQLLNALEQTRWNRKAAAELLGVTYRQFRYSLKKLGLE
jgi:two-component system response regulator PilR (NtrC family)